MAKNSKPFSPMRRRAVDRLLVQYLELPETEQPRFLDDCRQRFPRLARWLDQLLLANQTVTFGVTSVRDMADDLLSSMTTRCEKLAAGTRLGPWRILETAGEGGMGRVYRGERADEAFEMNVAIKLIANRRRGLAEVLQRESRLLAKLDHPVITGLLDAGLDKQAGPFLVMEWVEGDDLNDWLKGNPSIESRLDIIAQLAEALNHAHQSLIAHGDLKPANVRVRADGQVRLLDFGIARFMDNNVPETDSPAALTPNFAAPEQFDGEPPTPHADLWTLGALATWLLCEQLRDPHGEWKRKLRQQCPRHRDLAAILAKACKKSPEDRYSGVSAFAADLRRYRRIQPVRALPATAGYRLRRFVVRRRALASSLAAAVFLLIAGTLTATGLYLQADAERERTRVEAQKTARVSEFLVSLFESADPRLAQGDERTVREVVALGTEQIASLDESPEVQSELLQVLSRVNWGLGRFPQAVDLLERAVVLHEQLSERNEVDLARLYQRLGSAQHEAGNLQQAADSHQKSVDLAKGRNDALLASALSRLGITQRRLGDMSGAESSQRRALDLWREVAPDSIDMASSLNNLAIILDLTGRPDESIQRFEQALTIYTTELGVTHPQTINARGNLGTVYSNNGEYELAEVFLKETLKLRIDVLGLEHPAVANTQHGLGMLYFRLEDWDQAENYWSQSLATRKATQGEGHYSLGNTWLSLGILARKQGHFELAEQRLDNAIEIFQDAYGETHFMVARALENQALLARDQGALDRAVALGRQALEINLEVYGEVHSRVAHSKQLLARLYLQQDQIEKARQKAGHAHQITKQLHDDPQSPEILDSEDLLEQIEQNVTESKPISN